jgi:hypothetical protein
MQQRVWLTHSKKILQSLRHATLSREGNHRLTYIQGFTYCGSCCDHQALCPRSDSSHRPGYESDNSSAHVAKPNYSLSGLFWSAPTVSKCSVVCLVPYSLYLGVNCLILNSHRQRQNAAARYACRKAKELSRCIRNQTQERSREE